MLSRRCQLVLLAALMSAGCALGPTATTHSVTPAAMLDALGREMVRTELVFGLTREDASGIDESDWQDFIDKAIAVSFPAGFTVIDSTGRWRGPEGAVVNERSKVVLIFHDGSEATLRRLDELRRAYRQRFGAQSTIRASSNAWVAF